MNPTSPLITAAQELVCEEQKFYDLRWQKSDVSEAERRRIAETTAAVPAECRKILDVGCGDGRLSREINGARSIVGLDLSTTALGRFSGHKCCGSADQLPFADRSFDLVLSTEMLEHLPPIFYEKVLKEIERVSRKYVLVTVPNAENLDENIALCPFCGARFHLWGHVRSYSQQVLMDMFPNFEPVHIAPVGGLTDGYHRGLLWIRRNVTHTFAWEDGSVCYSCKRHLPPAPRLPFLARCCDFLNARWWSPYNRRAGWLLALYRRKET